MGERVVNGGHGRLCLGVLIEGSYHMNTANRIPSFDNSPQLLEPRVRAAEVSRLSAQGFCRLYTSNRSMPLGPGRSWITANIGSRKTSAGPRSPALRSARRAAAARTR